MWNLNGNVFLNYETNNTPHKIFAFRILRYAHFALWQNTLINLHTGIYIPHTIYLHVYIYIYIHMCVCSHYTICFQCVDCANMCN